MPTTKEIEEKVIEITSKQLNVPKEKMTSETHFVNDLGADSLDSVEIIMEIEDAFNVTIPDDVAEKIQTIGGAVKYIEEALKTAGKS